MDLAMIEALIPSIDDALSLFTHSDRRIEFGRSDDGAGWANVCSSSAKLCEGEACNEAMALMVAILTSKMEGGW